jgi:hypothetical protein
MSWAVRLQDQDGNPVEPQGARIEFATIPAEEKFQLLHYIHSHGDTYFNGRHMDNFLADWDNLNPSAEQRDQWQIVRSMAVRCRNEGELYLLFMGTDDESQA